MLEQWQKTPGVHKIFTDNGNIILLVDDSNKTLPTLFESASQVGTRIMTIETQEPNLETVFLHLTGKALRD